MTSIKKQISAIGSVLAFISESCASLSSKRHKHDTEFIYVIHHKAWIETLLSLVRRSVDLILFRKSEVDLWSSIMLAASP